MDMLILNDRIFTATDYIALEEDPDIGAYFTICEQLPDGTEQESAVYLNYESLRSLRNWINELLEEN